jgi:hypothetical protein
MKNNETLFDDYLNSNKTFNIHPKNDNIFKRFPTNIIYLKNIIFYGPPGIGKYTQALKCIKMYSQNDLKYEKKISINISKQVNMNKSSYFIKISDIHYEVDMSLLGCNSKLLWYEIYCQIIDIISAKSEKYGIILCKNFNKINSDLLENFYSYIQKNNISSIHISFILITEDLSFIPDNILNSCEIIHMSRPTKNVYNKLLNTKIPSNIKLETITNIKNLYMDSIHKYNIPHKIICDKILDSIINIDLLNKLYFRDTIYDLFIYNLNVNECVWYIISNLILSKHIKKEYIKKLMKKIYSFFEYYNNNYRPIYHLEYLFYYIISLVHGY